MITKRFFGTTKNGEDVHAYTLENDRGIAVTVLDYGATLQSVVLTHKGERIDVLLGYDTIEEYEQNDGYLGACIGRYAGRIPNAVQEFNDQSYPLAVNDNVNHLHGGRRGFDKYVFSAVCEGNSVTFFRRSPDGEEGYPASLEVSVSFTLDDTDTLSIAFRGVSDGVTCWNPTNHAYWNLNGHDSGNVLDHTLTLPADRFVPTDGTLIPISDPVPVDGTPFDFRQPKALGRDIHGDPIQLPNGYDHSFVLNGDPIELSGTVGIAMRIETDSRAVQLYTANFLTDRTGKGGTRYLPQHAVCLETQARQIQKDGALPQESILPANTPVTHTTRYRFLFQ